MNKETIEIMNLTNEIWHQFRNCLPFSAFFWQFLSESRDISSFSKNFRPNSIKFSRKDYQIHRQQMTKIGMKMKWNEMKWNFILPKKFHDFLMKFWGLSGAKAKESCRSRKILKNAPFLAIVAVDTAENEPLNVWAVSFHYFNPMLTHKHCTCGSVSWR